MAHPETLFLTEEFRAITDEATDLISLHSPDLRYVYVNNTLARATGLRPEDFPGRTFEQVGFAPRLAQLWTAKLEEIGRTMQAGQLEYETKLIGGTRVLQSQVTPIPGHNGALRGFLVISRDTTATARAELLRDAQNQITRLILGGATLAQLMETMVRLCEDNTPGRLCSILLLAPDRRHLVCGCAPHLPAELIDSIARRPIGPDNACCGAAIHQRRLAVSADIATDPAWAAHREIALAHGLRACWSEPIVATDGELLGSFAMYHRRARMPYERELRVVREATLMAALAIEHWRARESLLDAGERFRALTENAANIVTVLDRELVSRYVSPAVTAILGYSPDESTHQPITAGVHREDVPKVLEELQRLVADIGAQTVLQFRLRHKNGSWCTLESVAKSHRDRHGQVIIVVSTRDLTEREHITQALRDGERRLEQSLAVSREGEERLDRALTATGLGMWDWNIESGELYVDRHFADMMGYPPEAATPHVDWMLEHVHPDDRVPLLDAFGRHLKGQTPYCECEFRGQMQSGEWRWLELRGRVTQRRADGWALRMTGTNKDIHEHKVIQERLERAMNRVQVLLDATDEGIIGLDDVGTCTFVNPAALHILGCEAEDVLERDFSELVRHTRESGEELLGHDSPIHRCLTQGKRYRSGNDELFGRGPRTFPVEVSVSPIITGSDNSGAVLAFHDVTEKRTLQHQLQFQALHDPLTGLLNRRGFEQRLGELLDSAKHESRHHALCYLDMDQFKVVNDTCGHVAGDELLRQLPGVLRPQVGEAATIARLGGDEFAILLEDCPLDTAAQIAQQVHDAVRGFHFIWQHRAFAVGVSIGVVGITADGQGPTSVLGAADTACYIAKEEGASHVHVSYPHDLAIIRRRGEMRWVARLRRAMEENQFCLYYQSIAALDGAGSAPRLHELLIRLRDEKGGVILPGTFIPAAERYHLMSSVDQWVVEHALEHLGKVIVPDPALNAHRFGLNLSGESLRSAELLEWIRRVLARHRVPPAMLYFEITETAAITNLGAAIHVIQGLQELGCEIALDDFGSGMSSFSYLKHLPVDYLKIDGDFVRDIVNSRVDQSIVRAAHAVGQELGIPTIAEHVENAAALECLRGIGINYVQGYGIARPKPLEEFVQLQQPSVNSM